MTASPEPGRLAAARPVGARHTGISWTERTWALWGGCEPESEGCANCYAVFDAWRLAHNPLTPAYAGLVSKDPRSGVLRWTREVHYFPNASRAPLGWAAPAYVFTSSMTDVHLPRVPREWRVELYATMAVAGWHVFQTLTKHARELSEWYRDPPLDEIAAAASAMASERERRPVLYDPSAEAESVRHGVVRRPLPWPLPNVWAGVSAETQRLFEERVPLLAGTRALTTYVSMEPLIERVAPRGLLKGISQVVVGGESERRRGAARPFDPAWIDPIFDDCAGSSTARFVKQFGTVWARARGLAGKGDDPSQWEPRYRVQELPRGARPAAPTRHRLPVLAGAA